VKKNITSIKWPRAGGHRARKTEVYPRGSRRLCREGMEAKQKGEGDRGSHKE
jgi:hypothetical protein